MTHRVKAEWGSERKARSALYEPQAKLYSELHGELQAKAILASEEPQVQLKLAESCAGVCFHTCMLSLRVD